ncbi:PAS domain S-box protein [Microcoleus sp. LEGE 07076]|uniref:PAS domain-containing sensor histidine kinase n=1 Tax=Microcoleus sp. LEGE 07076 TaxID=915322 RepID=UPI00187FDAFE|nr:PAS domain S-box protein [Microcoleus sp. LEGE 07076]MBE9188096.1 PAS domain S-box protein [Microcoleus sp. LEGE 07076]
MQISSNSSNFKKGDSHQKDSSFLLSSEERYKNLVANIPGAVYRCTCDCTGDGAPTRTMTFLSEAIQEISGYPSSDFINGRVRSFASIIHPQDSKNVGDAVAKSAAAKTPYIVEYRIVRADGEISWVCEKGRAVCCEVDEARTQQGQGEIEGFLSAAVSPIANSLSQVVYLDGVILDITDRKRAEEILRNTQDFLNAVLQNLPVSVFIKDAVEQKFIYWNKASEKLFGYSSDEVMGNNAADLLEAEQSNYLQSQDLKVFAAGKCVDFPEETIQLPRRGKRILHNKKVPLFDEAGAPKYILAIAQDITESKQTETELLRLAIVAQKTQNGVIITDARGCIEWVNEGFTRISGYGLAEMLGNKLADVLQCPQTDPLTIAQLRSALAAGEAFNQEIYNYSKDGKGYWVALSIAPIYQETGELEGFIAVQTDITARKQAEATVSESESYYRCIVETASEGVWMFDSDSITTFANSRMAEMLGYTVEEMLGRSLFEFIDDSAREIAESYVQRRRQGIRERHDFKFIRSDGSHLWAIVSATPMFDSEGEFCGVLRMITDISDRKQAEAELRQTLQELEFEKFALDQSAIVSNTDEFGTITYVNNQFCELFKYEREELIGKTHRLVNSGYHQPDFFKQLWSTIRQGNVWRGEMKNQAKDGTLFWLDTTIVPFLNPNGDPHQYVAIRKDITAKKQAEEAVRLSESQLRAKNEELAKALRNVHKTQSMMVQNEKMVSLGQLVAGVAHEINNPVSFIYGNVMHADDYFKDLLKMLQLYQREYPEPTEAIREEIDDIDFNFLLKDLPKLLTSMKMGAERIRQIVLSLKNFSRLDEAEQKQVDIHEGIDSTLLILQHRFKETAGHPKIVLLKEFGDLPRVQCYAGQLNQVFMNIIANAIDALEEAMETGQWGDGEQALIPSCPSPTLRICTEVKYKQDVLIQANSAVSDSSIRHPSHIVIRIADNGPGIPIDVHERLFDPFFTTKEPGKGTGLGLSISYQIVVEKHGGELKCNSAPGQGTEFAIEIPVSRS